MRVVVVRVHGRQHGHALELTLEDLEVVAQREGAVLGEELVLGGQLAAHRARRLVDRGPPAQPYREDQQRRQDQGQLGAEGQAGNATTPRAAVRSRAILLTSYVAETRR